ncbi:hypothetical protein LINPERHAP1_LOCUS17726, partial [Linum perenne]
LQFDSKAVGTLLAKGCPIDHQLAREVVRFHELLERDKSIKIRLIYGEGNRVADYLLNLGHGLSMGLHLILAADSGLK